MSDESQEQPPDHSTNSKLYFFGMVMAWATMLLIVTMPKVSGPSQVNRTARFIIYAIAVGMGVGFPQVAKKDVSRGAKFRPVALHLSATQSILAAAYFIGLCLLAMAGVGFFG